MREGTGNFQNGDLLYMATHPVADAIRIGRTKPKPSWQKWKVRNEERRSYQGFGHYQV